MSFDAKVSAVGTDRKESTDAAVAEGVRVEERAALRAGAFSQVDRLVDDLSGDVMAEVTSDAAERRILGAIHDIGRETYQAYLEMRARRERLEDVPRWRAEGQEVRFAPRQIEAPFGRCTLERAAVRERGAAKETPWDYPLDRSLNLPPDLYSYELQRRAIDEVVDVSFEKAGKAIDATTGAHVPKRQLEEMVAHAATDVDAFYARERANAPANDSVADALLLMSSDSGGVRMIPPSLREATRKELEAAKSQPEKGDPMAQKKQGHKHDRRMAVVTLVADQARQVRTPKEVADRLRSSFRATKKDRPKRPKLLKPTNRHVRATLKTSQKVAIGKMFDEADRRDPERARTTVALVDGETRQKNEILAQSAARSRKLTLIVDLLHVLHYLWMAAKVLCAATDESPVPWVLEHMIKLLHCTHETQVVDMIGGIRQAATKRGLSAAARKKVDKCATYLNKNRAHVLYGLYLAAGFPIATGAIEGAVRSLLRDRMGITGACWGLETSEGLLGLRAVAANDDFDDYWKFHLERERDRNHGVAA